MIAGLYLTESLIDEVEFVEFQEDVSWVIENIWLSHVLYREIMRCYYVKGKVEPQLYHIDL